MVIKDFENKSKTGGTVLSVKKDHEKEAIHLEDLIRTRLDNQLHAKRKHTLP